MSTTVDELYTVLDTAQFLCCYLV